MGGSTGGQNQSGMNQYGLDLPQLNYSNLRDRLDQGQLFGGGKVPQYKQTSPYQFNSGNYQTGSFNTGSPYQFNQPKYSAFQFKTPSLQNAPQEAYSNVLNRGLDDIQMQQKMFGAQAARGTAARGYGANSGYLKGQQSDIARNAMREGAGLSANLGLEQARSQMDIDKTMGAWGMQNQASQAGENKFAPQLAQWMQQMQAGENLSRSGLGLEGQKATEASKQFGANLGQQYQQLQAGENLAQGQLGLQAQTQLSDLLLRQMGGLGSLSQAETQQMMAPYQMLSQLYGANLGTPFQVSQSGKGDPFSALLGLGSSAASGFRSPTSSAANSVAAGLNF